MLFTHIFCRLQAYWDRWVRTSGWTTSRAPTSWQEKTASIKTSRRCSTRREFAISTSYPKLSSCRPSTRNFAARTIASRDLGSWNRSPRAAAEVRRSCGSCLASFWNGVFASRHFYSGKPGPGAPGRARGCREIHRQPSARRGPQVRSEVVRRGNLLRSSNYIFIRRRSGAIRHSQIRR